MPPCDSVTTQSINLAKAAPNLLLDALKSLGWAITESTASRIFASLGGCDLQWTAGQGVTVIGPKCQEQTVKLTQAYSQNAISWAAQRAGWTVKQNADNKMTVTRR